MTVFSASTGSLTTAPVGSATLPFGGLYAPSAGRGIIREIKVFNTGTAAARIRIVRLSTAGTWTALTEAEHNEDFAAPLCTAVHTATSTAPTIVAGDLDVGAVGAAAGSGFVYTYYGEGRGIWIATGTGNGIGLIETADTANGYDFTFVWDE